MNRKALLSALLLAAAGLFFNPVPAEAASGTAAPQSKQPADDAHARPGDFGAPAAEPFKGKASDLPVRLDRTSSEDGMAVYHFVIEDEADAQLYDQAFFKSAAMKALCRTEDFKNPGGSGKKLALRFENRNKKELLRAEADAGDCGKTASPVHVSSSAWKIQDGSPGDIQALLQREKEKLASGLKDKVPGGAASVSGMEFIEAGKKTLGTFRIEQTAGAAKIHMAVFLGAENGEIREVLCMSPDESAGRHPRCRARVEETFGVKLQ